MIYDALPGGQPERDERRSVIDSSGAERSAASWRRRGQGHPMDPARNSSKRFVCPHFRHFFLTRRSFFSLSLAENGRGVSRRCP